MKNLIFKLNKIKNYFYYLRSSFIKNCYPCKLIGEKIGLLDKEQLIMFRVLGQSTAYCQSLNTLFLNKNLIECFSPKDTLLLGKIAFYRVILSLPVNEQLNHFKKIKEIMLLSTHDIYPFSNLFSFPIISAKEKEDDLALDFFFITRKNIYPFKLVGYETNNYLAETLIIYTIFGKREGHKKSLQNIINQQFIEKFHPTEAIKFGFISAGDEFFAKN